MTKRGFRKLLKRLQKEAWKEAGATTSYHEPQFGQDFHDDQGRLIHAEWDGILGLCTCPCCDECKCPRQGEP